MLEEFGYIAHIKARGEEAKELKKSILKKARRWVVERTHSWMNRFRGIPLGWVNNLLFALFLPCQSD